MGSAVLMLSAAYALPLALAALALVKAGVRSRAVVVVLILLPAFYFLHYQGLKQVTGWPAREELPERFELLAEQVREPDKQSGRPGAVYLWLSSEDAGPPRAFELPYSVPLHRDLAEASERRRKGRPQTGIKRDRAGQTTEGDKGPGDVHYEFVDRPGRRLPPKDGAETPG